MATSANDDDRPGPTPVPPRGGKRKPNRPTSKGPAAGRPGASARPADNRRATLAARRRRNQTLLAGGAIVAIIAVVVVFIVVRSSPKTSAAVPVPAATLSDLTSSVSVQEMAAAANNYGLTAVSGEGAAYPKVVNDPPITTTGKPVLLYIGGEYCPFCATERWPLVLALSKFGTFTNLSHIHSSSTDSYPSTPTFTFYKSSYTSPYLTFTAREIAGATPSTPLQSVTKAQQAIENAYDSGGTIPFAYFNGKAIISGAEYDPQLLHGKSFQQVAASITGGQSTLAKNVTADAGVIVSDLCRMTGGQPGSVCSLFPKALTG